MSVNRNSVTKNRVKKYTPLKILGGDSMEFKNTNDVKAIINEDNYEKINNLCIKVLIKELYTTVKFARDSKISFVSEDKKHNTIDPFTHMLISIYGVLENHPNQPHWFFKYFKRMGIISPLFVLFILSILTPEELKNILKMYKRPFDNSEMFKKMCTVENSSKLDEDCNKRETLIKEIKTAKDIESNLNTFIRYKMKDYIGDNVSEVTVKFGSVENFEKWVKMVFEYTSMFTQPFIRAFIEKDYEKLKSIIEIFNDMYHVDSKNKIGTVLLESLDSTIFSQQLFCKHLEYLTNIHYFSTPLSVSCFDNYSEFVLDGTCSDIKPDNMELMTTLIEYINISKGYE
jgi:hypothetical protein